MPRIEAKKNKNLCLAPWTHTYISPQSERRLCCASREQATFTRQYIDSKNDSNSDTYGPVSLEEHWNSSYMKNIRKKMMAGENIPECSICQDQILNIYTYRSYFNETLFPELLDEIYKYTDDDGHTTLKTRSFDYRFTNFCNYKCRMCGEQLSSSWEDEKRKHGLWDKAKDQWMLPENREKIEAFTNDIVKKEFEDAIENSQIEEIYWVGGEPLMWPDHWRLMDRIIEKNDSHKVFVRYNTNLHIIKYQGIHLFEDLLVNFKGFNLCASIDGTGKIGEYIRTGLNWERWKKNFIAGLPYIQKFGRDCLVMDVTLTLPGLFSIIELVKFSNEYNVKMYVKTVFSFDSSIIMSPLALPRHLLNKKLKSIISELNSISTENNFVMIETLNSLINKQNFEEEYPSDFQAGLSRGKQNILNLEKIRKDSFTMRDILASDIELLNWWDGIDE